MRKLSVREYAQEQGVAEKTVYQWIKSNRVKHIKETRNNQEVTVILVDTVQNEVKPTLNPTEQNNSLQIQSSIPASEEIVSLLKEMYKDNKYLAELAGQTKLLTDSESRTKQQYFEIIQENKQLNRVNVELATKLSLFDEQKRNLLQEKEERAASLTQQLEATQEKLKELENKLKQQEQAKLNNWFRKI